MDKEKKIILRNLAEELSTSKDPEEIITSMTLLALLGSIKNGSIFEFQKVVVQFAKNQVKIIEKIEKISHMRQN